MPSVTGVSVTGAAPTLGGRSQFTATASLSNGQTRNVTSEATWGSSAPSVATVTAGLVTAVGVGSATISATFENVRGTSDVSVASSGTLNTFMRDYIEALFLGTGPLTPTDGVRGCPQSFGRWLGFPAGTSVQLVISSMVPEPSVKAIVDTGAMVPAATHGMLSVTATTTSDPNPLPAANQVTATAHQNPISTGCGFAQGCTRFTFLPGTPLILSARAVLATSQFTPAYVHDAVGHGVLGLCHVDGNLIGGARLSLMSFGPGVFSNQLPPQLSDFDMQAVQVVFASGLSPGATRDDFLRLGLVNAPTGSTPARPGALGTTGHVPSVPAGR